MIDLAALLSSLPDDAPLAAEAGGLLSGALRAVRVTLAGLQFYDYAQPDGLDGTVRPLVGDRLHPMRRPENLADANAVEVWWKNEFMIGHLPRSIAAQVASLMDEGKALRAYVVDGGDGSAWSLGALLIGPALESIHDREDAEVIEGGIARMMVRHEPRRFRHVFGRAWRDAQRFHFETLDRRRERIHQAADVLLAMPFEPSLPSIGKTVDLADVAKAIGVREPEARSLVEAAGIVLRPRYPDYPEDPTTRRCRFTARLRDRLTAYAGNPTPLDLHARS